MYIRKVVKINSHKHDQQMNKQELRYAHQPIDDCLIVVAVGGRRITTFKTRGKKRTGEEEEEKEKEDDQDEDHGSESSSSKSSSSSSSLRRSAAMRSTASPRACRIVFEKITRESEAQACTSEPFLWFQLHVQSICCLAM